jgi:hypothetical protein
MCRTYQPWQRAGNHQQSPALLSRKSIQRLISPWMALPHYTEFVPPVIWIMMWLYVEVACQNWTPVSPAPAG